MKRRASLSGTPLKLIFIAVTVVVIVILLCVGSVNVRMTEESIAVSATLTSGVEIPYEDIQGVLLDTDLETGHRIFGIGSLRLKAGDFKNEKYGDYQLYAYASADTYVVLQYSGGIVAFALEDSDATTTAYETLMKHVDLD